MGLFSRGKSGTDTRPDSKQRARASKAGVDVVEALYVAEGLGEGAAKLFLVVHPDRVELHNLGKPGLTRQGAGVQSVRADRISSVSTQNKGISCVVTVEAAGSDLAFSADVNSGPAVADAIRSIAR